MTKTQIKILRDYKVIIAADNDEAGERAVVRIAQGLRSDGQEGIRFLRCPQGLEVKDWNAFYVKFSKALIRKFATEKTRPIESHLFL